MQFRKNSFFIWSYKSEAQEKKFLFHQLSSECEYSVYLFKLAWTKIFKNVHVGIKGWELFVFLKFLRLLFSCYLRFEIRESNSLVFTHINPLKMRFYIYIYIYISLKVKLIFSSLALARHHFWTFTVTNSWK